jgi:hypothetical protein
MQTCVTWLNPITPWHSTNIPHICRYRYLSDLLLLTLSDKKDNVVNSNKSPTSYNRFPVCYPDVHLQLNMFRAGDSHALFAVGPPVRPRTLHDCHHDTKVKPEAAIAVIELLMMGGKTPETCWAVNKSQDNKLKNWCIRLVIYLHCTMMHGLTNLKFMMLSLDAMAAGNWPTQQGPWVNYFVSH